MFIKKCLYKLKHYFLLYLFKEPQKVAKKAWVREKGDDTCRVDYDLRKSSHVLDVGGYLGEWAEKIENKYHPHIDIFEPVPCYFQKIKQKFEGNNKISVHNYAIGNKNEKKEITVGENSSSLYRQNRQKGNERITVLVRNIVKVIEELNLTEIDLIKINIEGGEYCLLQRIIDEGLISRFKNIQVQFHNFIDDAINKREAIRSQLKKTHRLTYDFYFIWENWQRK